MHLSLKSHDAGEIVIVRCYGRIVSGDEARFLQSELERLTTLTKNVVLELSEVTFVDSGGLGALVRLLGVLRAARGDLKLCKVPPFVVRVLEITNLLNILHPYASEKEAMEAFSLRPVVRDEAFPKSNSRIVCLDSSLDLLAYLRVLLQRSGYEVFTTQYASDAVTFVKGAETSLVICGPGIQANQTAIDKFRLGTPNVRLLHLPPDFSVSEADQAGPDLVNQVRSLLASRK